MQAFDMWKHEAFGLPFISIDLLLCRVLQCSSTTSL